MRSSRARFRQSGLEEVCLNLVLEIVIGRVADSWKLLSCNTRCKRKKVLKLRNCLLNNCQENLILDFFAANFIITPYG
jgi:hypothetical protein